MIRAKFVLLAQKNSEGYWKGKPAIQADYNFIAVYSEDPESENKKYWDATPSGQLILSCVNPAVLKEFVVDQEYYVDITPVESSPNRRSFPLRTLASV